jgi:uncharacterized protein (TIGR02246 family)
MRFFRNAVLIGAIVVNLAIHANAGGSSASGSSDEIAIRKIDAAWSRAANAKDLDEVVRLYAVDGSILPFNAPIATGTAAIRQVWSSLVSKPGYSLTLSPMKITVAASRDIAWELGTFELKLNDAQGKPTAIPGKYVVAWTKIDGAWKVSADVFNTDN